MRGVLAIACALLFGACATAAPAPVKHVVTAPVAASSAAVEAASAEPPVEEEPEEEITEAPPAAPVATAACNPQKPFEYLIRTSYIPVKQKKKEHEKALRFRTTTYGYVKGFGEPAWNNTVAKSQVVSATVFGCR
jgi:hypothetical protein